MKIEDAIDNELLRLGQELDKLEKEEKTVLVRGSLYAVERSLKRILKDLRNYPEQKTKEADG